MAGDIRRRVYFCPVGILRKPLSVGRITRLARQQRLHYKPRFILRTAIRLTAAAMGSARPRPAHGGDSYCCEPPLRLNLNRDS